MKKLLNQITNWITVDGFLHLFASLAISSMIGMGFMLYEKDVIKGVCMAFAFGMMFGIWKEMYDAWKSRVTTKKFLHDILCDLIGIAIGIVYILCMYNFCV
jgi:hypothetical protein